MRKLALLTLLALLPLAAEAQVKISALPAATTPLTGAEILPCDQSGTTKQCTATSLGAIVIPPASSVTATLYVTTTGNDTFNCLSWVTACSTIQHAIALLPANGGIVEVGYGTFAQNVVISAQAGVRIRGRGIARSTSVQDNSQPVGAYPTLITGNVVVAAGNNSFTESVWASGTVLEDFAVSTTTNLYGVKDCLFLASPNVTIRRVAFDSCGNRGVFAGAAVVFTATPSGTSGTLATAWGGATNTYQLTFSDGTTKSVTLTNNSAAVSWSGAIVSSPLTTVQVASNGTNFIPSIWFTTFEDDRFIKNGAQGIQGAVLATQFIGNNDFDGNTATAVDFATFSGTQEVSFVGGIIQRNSANTSGGVAFNGTTLTMTGTHIEGNYGALANQNNGEIQVGTGAAIILGCEFVPANFSGGVSGTNFGIGIAGGSQTSVIGGNYVIAGTGSQWGLGFIHGGTQQSTGAADNPAMNFPGIAYGNVIAGSGAIPLIGGFNTAAISQNAFAYQLTGGPRGDSIYPIDVTGAGSTITLRPDYATIQRIYLNGGTVSTTNVTTSNISPGQEIEVHWLQDATGGRTYAWPAIFQNNPAAGPFTTTNATASTEDVYVFRCMTTPGGSTVCQEKSRALGVGGSAAAPGVFSTLTANGAVNLNASNNAVTNIGTGTTTSQVSIGGGSNTVVIGSATQITGVTSINASNNAATNIGTGSTTSTVNLGGGSNTIAVNGALNATGVVSLNASNNAATNIGTGTTTSNVNIGGTADAINLGAPVNLTTAGALSANSWTTNGLVISGTGRTLTDATGSGTITTEAAAALPAYTINTTAAGSTITNLDELYLPAPIAGANVTATNLWSLQAIGGVKTSGQFNSGGGILTVGGVASFNSSSNFNTNINTGTSTGAITIGNAGTTGVTSLNGLSTGTNADFLCLSSGGVVLLQASACTISSARFKEEIEPLADDAWAALARLSAVAFTMRTDAGPRNRDENYYNRQAGLLAENVAQAMPYCAIYERDQKTPKSYRQECVLAYAIQALQAEHARVRAQQIELYGLGAVCLAALLFGGALRRRAV